jgi:hypothetical protein
LWLATIASAAYCTSTSGIGLENWSALLGLVLADAAPVWVLAVAAVLTLRPFVRFAFRVAGRILLDD